MALWLLKTNRFSLDEVIERKGLNYFAYALLKGLKAVALEILQKLSQQGQATDEIINQRIETGDAASEVTLFEMCIARRYKSGLYFLLNHCKVQVPSIQRQQAMQIIEEGSSVRSINDYTVSMADRTSQGSGDRLSNFISSHTNTEEKKVR